MCASALSFLDGKIFAIQEPSIITIITSVKITIKTTVSLSVTISANDGHISHVQTNYGEFKPLSGPCSHWISGHIACKGTEKAIKRLIQVRYGNETDTLFKFPL